mgnify:CR=1 FL=1
MNNNEQTIAADPPLSSTQENESSVLFVLFITFMNKVSDIVKTIVDDCEIA